MRRLASCVLLFGLVAAGAGCASPRSDFYTLNAAAKPVATRADYSVSVGPCPSRGGGPPADRYTARAEPGRHRRVPPWASPLPDAIARVVAENLAAMLGTSHVTVFSQPTAAGARYRVLVDVLRFESAPGEVAILDAVWTVRSTTDGSTRSGRTHGERTRPGREFATLAAAHSRALGRLSEDLAGAIRALSPAGGRPHVPKGGIARSLRRDTLGQSCPNGGGRCGNGFYSRASPCSSAFSP